MTVKKIDKADKYRVILTDTVPYEMPVICSNDSLHAYVTGGMANEFVNHLLEKRRSYTIPFDYKIKKGSSGYRKLSVIHPAVQLEIADFYEEYREVLVHLCSRSNYSIRFPFRVASTFYDKDLISPVEVPSNAVEVEHEGIAQHNKYSSSYFAYKKYNLLHRFYDSYEFHRLEKKYKYLDCVDLSKCFHSIYTHSVAWAVKSKKYAKSFLKTYSFESRLDSLAQRSNYNETNGIVIGPEFSRIFAEIILQEIDRRTENSLISKKLINGKDYDIRRYIDDFFIFHNDEKVYEVIFAVIEGHLEEFKLHFNSDKHKRYSRPFITSITCAKIDIKKFFSEIFTSHVGLITERVCLDNDLEACYKIKSPLRNAGREANRLISEYKSTLHRHGVKYSELSGYSLKAIKLNVARRLSDLSKHVSSLDHAHVSDGICVWIEFLFFLCCMDCRSRTIYTLSQVLVAIGKFTKHLNGHVAETIKKKIFDESILLASSQLSDRENYNSEILNLLLVLKSLGEDYSLSEKHLCAFVGVQSINCEELAAANFNYFQIVSILFYCSGNPAYSTLIEEVERYCVHVIESGFDEDCTEQVLLVLDFVGCPAVSLESKRRVVEHALKVVGRGADISSVNFAVNFISRRSWFTNWNGLAVLDRLLQKKELCSPY